MIVSYDIHVEEIRVCNKVWQFPCFTHGTMEKNICGHSNI